MGRLRVAQNHLLHWPIAQAAPRSSGPNANNQRLIAVDGVPGRALAGVTMGDGGGWRRGVGATRPVERAVPGLRGFGRISG